MDSDHLLDPMAQVIFQAALDEGRCGELLEALFKGGSATIDAKTHKLVIANSAMLGDLIRPLLSEA